MKELVHEKKSLEVLINETHKNYQREQQEQKNRKLKLKLLLKELNVKLQDYLSTREISNFFNPQTETVLDTIEESKDENMEVDSEPVEVDNPFEREERQSKRVKQDWYDQYLDDKMELNVSIELCEYYCKVIDEIKKEKMKVER